MAMQQRYRISFVVDKELVPTVTALVVDRVSSLHIEEVERERHTSVRHGRANGRVRDMTWARPAYKAVAQWMVKHGADKEHHYTDLATALPAVGVGEGSISPITSGMVAAGIAMRVKSGTYKLTEKGKAMAE